MQLLFIRQSLFIRQYRCHNPDKREGSYVCQLFLCKINDLINKTCLYENRMDVERNVELDKDRFRSKNPGYTTRVSMETPSGGVVVGLYPTPIPYRCFHSFAFAHRGYRYI